MTTTLPRRTILTGDAATTLTSIAANSIDMVLTSPPYFRLRDYGVAGQLGAEASVDDWATSLRAVTAELARVLVPTGSLWLNLGDSYAASDAQGASRKSLLLAPERIALDLIANGWLLRNKIVWHKPNPMPNPVRDRLTCAYEVVYVFVRAAHYYFDLDDIRLPHRTPEGRGARSSQPATNVPWRGSNAASRAGLDRLRATGRVGHSLGKNPGDVWTFANAGLRGQHRATFPLRLAERAIRAGCPVARCTACRLPWRRSLLRAVGGTAVRGALTPGCDCGAAHQPGVVLDPFIGSGTTAVAAEALGRDWLGIELNPAFADVARQRVYAARAGPPAA